jgi:outer membrane receptor protein involved in Fe transport
MQQRLPLMVSLCALLVGLSVRAQPGRVISGEELRGVPSVSLEQALQGRLPLATFGAGPSLRLSSGMGLAGPGTPLYVVDGFVSTRTLAELDTYDVERVEVLDGPAAIARYGSQGAAGALVITTRRAGTGPVRARVSQRVGTLQLARKEGTRTFASAEEAVSAFGEGARAQYQEGRVFDYEEELAGRLGPALETRVELGAGSEHTRFFVAGFLQHGEGPFIRTGIGKQGLKLAFEQEMGSAVRVSVTAHALHWLQRRGFALGTLLWDIPSFLDLHPNADGTYPPNPFSSTQGNLLRLAHQVRDDTDAWRLFATAAVEAKLWAAGPHLLTLGAHSGVDRLGQGNTGLFPPDPFMGRETWTRLDTTLAEHSLSGQLALDYRFAPESGALRLEASLGAVLQEELSNIVSVLRLPADPDAPADTNPDTVFSRRQRADLRALFVRAGALLDERLSLEAGARLEQLEGRGIVPVQLAPSISIAYRLHSRVLGLDEVRPRLAYTESALLLRELGYPSPASPVTGPGPGPAALAPERVRVLEAGVDLVALGGRLTARLRAFQQQLVVVLSPFGFNAGELLGRGAEAALDSWVVRRDGLEWRSGASVGVHRLWTERLEASAFQWGGLGLAALRFQEGTSVTQIWGRDGFLPDGSCCVWQALGDVQPHLRASFHNELRIGAWSLRALLDWKQGGDTVNLRRFVRDLNQTSPDFVPAGQARLDQLERTVRPYVEDTSFLALREVAVSYTLRASWDRVIPGVQEVQLIASARNVLTLTGYSGPDPEVGAIDIGGPGRLTVGNATPVRSLWVALEAGF